MEDNLSNRLKDSITRELAGYPDARREIINKFPVSEEKHLDFLKDVDSISEIRKLISNKKLSNRQIKNHIRKFLKNPDELIQFLETMLENTDSKKEESKEATGTGGGSGAFVTKIGSQPDEYVNKVPTVRESEEYCDSCDRVKSKCVCEKPKKTETKEATGSASSGSYSQPAIWAKSMNKKDFAGYKKPLYKGGKFVQVKKKCKKFPYCNQGDIKALKIFENENVQNAIDSVSSRFKIDKSIISELVFQKIRKSIK